MSQPPGQARQQGAFDPAGWGGGSGGVPGHQTPVGAPQRPKRYTGWVVGIYILAAVLAAGIVVIVVQDEGGDDDDASATDRSPEEAAEGYVAALQDRDCEALLDHVLEAWWSEDGTRSRQEAMEACQDSIDSLAEPFDALELTEVELVNEADGTAVVEMTSTFGGESESVDRVTLHLEDGSWHVDQSSFTLTDSG